jgi:hypothetical protein
MTSIPAGENTIEIIPGTDTDGTMNRFQTTNFIRTGRAGKRITIGEGNEPGVSRAISLARNASDRNSDSNGKSTISRGLKSGNISSPKHEVLTANSHNSRRGTDHNRNNARHRVSNLSALKDSNSLRSRGNPNNTRGEHSINSLKEDLTEAIQIQITNGDIPSESQTLDIPAARL